MKALNPLTLLFLVCSTSLLFALEDNQSLESYISESKKEQFKYDYLKIKSDNSKILKSLISPLRLNYRYGRSKPYEKEQITQRASIDMNQPIFQSGGIYYAIKYANANAKYLDNLLEVQQRALSKQAFSLLIQIKQLTFKIQKQELKIQNSKINLSQKEEQYLHGQLDSGFLDNAIIENNIFTQVLYDLKTSKQKLISNLKVISDIDYSSVDISPLKILEKEDFINNNISLKTASSEVLKNLYYKDTIISKYLLSVNFIAGYSWEKNENLSFAGAGSSFSTENNTYNYGITASIPLDISIFDDIESSRLSYLKSKSVLIDKRVELVSIYEQVMHNIENFKKKQSLSLSNVKIYRELLKDTINLFKSGYKTQYDVDLLKNSMKIQEIDFQIFQLDRELELLNLYEIYKK